MTARLLLSTGIILSFDSTNYLLLASNLSNLHRMQDSVITSHNPETLPLNLPTLTSLENNEY